MHPESLLSATVPDWITLSSSRSRVENKFSERPCKNQPGMKREARSLAE